MLPQQAARRLRQCHPDGSLPRHVARRASSSLEPSMSDGSALRSATSKLLLGLSSIKTSDRRNLTDYTDGSNCRAARNTRLAATLRGALSVELRTPSTRKTYAGSPPGNKGQYGNVLYFLQYVRNSSTDRPRLGQSRRSRSISRPRNALIQRGTPMRRKLGTLSAGPPWTGTNSKTGRTKEETAWTSL